jgi:hypothetical protein
LTTGSPRLPEHSCEWENKEMKAARDKKNILIDKRRQAFALTIRNVLIQLN